MVIFWMDYLLTDFPMWYWMTYNSGSICWAGSSILQSHFTYGTSNRVAMFEAIEWTGLLEPVESNIRILALERCTLCVVVSMITRET